MELTMTTLLEQIGTVFTQAITWVGDVLDVITGNPALILVCISMPVIGFAVGLLQRMWRTN